MCPLGGHKPLPSWTPLNSPSVPRPLFSPSLFPPLSLPPLPGSHAKVLLLHLSKSRRLPTVQFHKNRVTGHGGSPPTEHPQRNSRGDQDGARCALGRTAEPALRHLDVFRRRSVNQDSCIFPHSEKQNFKIIPEMSALMTAGNLVPTCVQFPFSKITRVLTLPTFSEQVLRAPESLSPRL